MKKELTLITTLSLLFAMFLSALNASEIISIPIQVLFSLRWLAIGILTYYGWNRKSLTIWIFISMII
ncbi:MAG: dicarboxylate/amino acid:cation symporter, partial [Candidatus Sericytochromatia bacterium]